MKRTAVAKATGLLIGALILLAPLESSAYYRGRGGIGIGIGIGVPYYGYGYGYSPYYYPPDYYYGPNYYYPPPDVAYESPAPPTVVAAPSSFWYYCPPARAYFPYVRECPSGWQAVPAAQQSAAARKPPAPAPAGRVTYRLGDVLFATGQSELQPAATGTLDSLLVSIGKEPNRHLVIEGHTDSVGSGAENLSLSQRRADAVKQYLVGHGFPADRITAIGKGEAGAIASNGTAEGRRQNRRVDVVVS